MSGEYLEHSIVVSSADVDARGEFKPAALLSLCQEVAYMHSSRLGFGFERLRALNLAWVLSRAEVRIERMPRWREEITVKTWHKGQSGLFSLRDYTFTNAEGEELVRVTTSWLIINIATRRITRLDRVPQGDTPIKFCIYERDAIEGEAPRIDAIEGGYAADSHSVRYSDIDLNQHVNNAKYVEWLIDRSPRQCNENLQLKMLAINFNHEALIGEVVDISVVEEGDSISIDGASKGCNIFTSHLTYDLRQ